MKATGVSLEREADSPKLLESLETQVRNGRLGTNYRPCKIDAPLIPAFRILCATTNRPGTSPHLMVQSWSNKSSWGLLSPVWVAIRAASFNQLQYKWVLSRQKSKFALRAGCRWFHLLRASQRCHP